MERARSVLLAVLMLAGVFSVWLLAASPVQAADYTVTTLQDAPHASPLDGTCRSTLPGGICTLRAALEAANFAPGSPNTISLSQFGTYLLDSALSELRIDAGSRVITNTSGSAVTIGTRASGDMVPYRIFHVGATAPATLTLDHIKLQGGTAVTSPVGGSSGGGGGVRVEAGSTLVTHAVTIQGNVGDPGGGIYNLGTSTLDGSTITGNLGNLNGAGVANIGGTLTLVNSTIAGNSHASPGAVQGEQLLIQGGTVRVTYSTLAGGIHIDPSTPAQVNAQASIITPLSASCTGSPFASQGDNVTDSANCLAVNTARHDQLIPSGTSIVNNQPDVSGPVPVLTTFPGSPAIDAVTFNTCPPPTTDARGTVRPQGTACDAGAYEAASTLVCTPRPPIQVTTRPGSGLLAVDVRATSNPGQPNQLLTLDFGTPQNGQITITGATAGSTTVQTTAFTFTVPVGRSTQSFTVRRVQVGQATTVPFTVTDSCGSWPTFVGGGANAF